MSWVRILSLRPIYGLARSLIYTIWMDTIQEGQYADTNAIFETPTHVDYHVKKWFKDTHAELMKVVTNYIARNKRV